MAASSSSSSSFSRKLSRNPNRRCFFKVMVPGFDTRLVSSSSSSFSDNLPLSFCKHISLERSSREAVITTSKGSWRIDVCKNRENGQIYFGNGWDVFVKKHELRIADFLLFQHLEKLSFQVIVFDRSTNCEKQFHSIEKTRKLSVPRKSQKMVPEDHSAAAGSPYFSTTMNPSNVRKWSPSLTIPVSFWRSHGLSKQHSVLLRGPSKEPHMVNLRQSKMSSQLTMATGWREFFDSYNLQVGDICRFKINGTTDESIRIMDVEINPK